MCAFSCFPILYHLYDYNLIILLLADAILAPNNFFPSCCVRYRTVPEIIPRERVEAADPRDYRVFARRETEVVPRSDRLDEYYALRAARGAMDPPPQAGYLRPGYEDPHRRYADYHSRPVSGNGNASNVSVSSLYSFAGAPSSYRAL